MELFQLIPGFSRIFQGKIEIPRFSMVFQGAGNFETTVTNTIMFLATTPKQNINVIACIP